MCWAWLMLDSDSPTMATTAAAAAAIDADPLPAAQAEDVGFGGRPLGLDDEPHGRRGGPLDRRGDPLPEAFGRRSTDGEVGGDLAVGVDLGPAARAGGEVGLDLGPLVVVDGIEGVGPEQLLDGVMRHRSVPRSLVDQACGFEPDCGGA